jgi:hypothetical protein
LRFVNSAPVSVAAFVRVVWPQRITIAPIPPPSATRVITREHQGILGKGGNAIRDAPFLTFDSQDMDPVANRRGPLLLSLDVTGGGSQLRHDRSAACWQQVSSAHCRVQPSLGIQRPPAHKQRGTRWSWRRGRPPVGPFALITARIRYAPVVLGRCVGLRRLAGNGCS